MCKLSKIRGGYILYSEENIRGSELSKKDMYAWVSRTGRLVHTDSRFRSYRRRVYWVYNVKNPAYTVERYYLNHERKMKNKFGW